MALASFFNDYYYYSSFSTMALSVWPWLPSLMIIIIILLLPLALWPFQYGLGFLL